MVRLVCLLLSISTLSFGGTVQGRVIDTSGAVIPAAQVELRNPLTGFRQQALTDAQGRFRFLSVAPNTYHLEFVKQGFANAMRDVFVHTNVPIEVEIRMTLAEQTQSIEVEAFGSDILENVPHTHYDVDRSSLERLPVSSPGASFSDGITLTAPGVVANSNGFFHPLGDHAQAAFVVDGQPINDQQSKQFSTQLPLNAIQAMELITGGVAAEFGDKTSLVVNAQTRSGMDAGRPNGSVAFGYGSFGSPQAEATLAAGTRKLGSFLALNGLRTGRFLDTPEFRPIHAIGNNGSVFHRFDFRPNDRHHWAVNFFAARNWFQIPNTLDQPNQDQRQKSESWSIAPNYTWTVNATTVLNLNGFTREDRINYYPSRNPLDDLPGTISQRRHLGNSGGRADLSMVRGRHTLRFGAQAMATRLDEQFRFGVTDEHLVEDAPGLLPYLLTEGGRPFQFAGRRTIAQYAGYAQDSISLGGLTVNAGLRFDRYNGLATATGWQPRLGASYQIRRTGTVLRYAYSRTMETPYNENLILSSATGAGGLAENVFGAFGATPLQPGRRHQNNAGIQQAFGRRVQVDADYFWKQTNNAYDFGALFDTSIFFPISWRQSKIDGLAVRVALAEWRGLHAYTLLGRSRSRFFGPSNGGLLFNSPVETEVFRIDHDQAFQQTTFVRYQYKRGPWVAFTWRYDSGLVAGAGDDKDELLELSGARQAAMGLFCGSTFARPGAPITDCGSGLGATRIRLSLDGNPDHNPPRIAPRHLFNLSVGTDNLFRTERYRTTLRLNAVNLTNRVALYNFLSTFAGTHFITPRAYTAQLGFVF